jgi:tetratricopeptide (TPR) repeat protein
MKGRTSLKNRRLLLILLAALWLGGCSGTPVSWGPPFPPRTDVGDTVPGGEPSDPRARASLQLTRQGRTFLEEGKPDEAISVLERAVGLDPSNGLNYFYLAEAWLLKDNLEQAGEFNRLAGIYLEGDFTWMRRVREQREWINTLRK